MFPMTTNGVAEKCHIWQQAHAVTATIDAPTTRIGNAKTILMPNIAKSEQACEKHVAHEDPNRRGHRVGCADFVQDLVETTSIQWTVCIAHVDLSGVCSDVISSKIAVPQHEKHDSTLSGWVISVRKGNPDC